MSTDGTRTRGLGAHGSIASVAPLGRAAHAARAAASWLFGLVRRSAVLLALRSDRVLAIAFGVLSLSAMLPVFASPILPLTDVGFNAMAGFVVPLAFGDPFLSEYFGIHWYPIPYWSAYALQGALSVVIGPLLAVRLLAAMLAVLLPLSVLRLAIALGRSPRIALVAFVLSWDTNLYWGWLSFQLGMALCLWSLARVIECETYRGALRVWPWTALVGISHPHAIVLLAVAGVVVGVTRQPWVSGLLRSSLALSGTLLTVVPWLAFGVVGGHRAPELHSYTLEQASFTDKINGLHTYTLGNYFDSEYQAVAALAFLALLLTPALLSALPQKNSGARGLGSVLALGGAALFLYLVLPFAFWGGVYHWWTYPRYATYVLLGVLLVPRPDLSGLRFVALLPGICMAAGVHLCTALQFEGFSERARAFIGIIDALPERKRLLPLNVEWSHPGLPNFPVLSLHGYAAMEKLAYDPHLFDIENNPIYYKVRLPHPVWTNQRTFVFEQHGKFYDFILMYPKSRDLLLQARRQGKVHLTRESGDFRLYEVVAPVEP